MQIVEVKSGFEICGLKTRTSNALEMSGHGKIAALWDKFLKFSYDETGEIFVPQSEIYAVYHDYESDFNGKYSLLIGVKADTLKPGANLEKIYVHAGRYAVFSIEDLSDENLDAKGADLTIALWKAIWVNFENSSLKRAYDTDFELYSGDEIKIYISIK
ncbi:MULTISPECIES: GyrI-like domain-containing protein [Campylobacter]|uniref:GyrI-like domain-containing protein n=1 Tax=Campylobacter TaxID=194 RepID=UPI0014707DC9|nr:MULTISPECIES: GyrI-like domain-containing protein [Campylobacter]MBN7288590.1 GyrI-like domain-containing protein [Campylobacter curvus]MDU6828188.1 GyrI-like domain-containing protein [Campylobacter sp.]